jgi:hypothetical protein
MLIGRWLPMSRVGCVDGCALNTKSAAADAIDIRMPTCMMG